MSNLFPSIDPADDAKRRPRAIGRVPIRAIIPNMVTLLALCAGLTAVRMTIEERYELAIYAVLAAAVLDGLDGRIARFLKSTSRFGAELDSLSDFVSFGVAPAILLYGWILHEAKSFGWVAALVFASAGALRLARFNVASTEEKPAWQSNFFTGVPAPAGALLSLLPLYISFSGLTVPVETAPLVLIYTVLVALLMVSRIPTFSGKKLGRIRRDLVFPLFVGLGLAVGLLIRFPFETLALVAVAYIVAIPFGWRAWNRLAREHGESEREIGFETAIEPEETGEDESEEKP
ncbi:MAG TPA: CDP-diacylglycerol--serine O-phosphatidyltransferase [Methylomirabilota bacterium]|nr:CDP-diacylglycerol--serine O-phosphatidyltransferase [Methylomirabilota bacterium]